MDWLLLITAALGAGLLNAMAGGGSFLTFPALIFTGIAPIPANATSAVAVSPGYLGSALGFRQELASLPRRRLLTEALICAIGGVAGSLLLIVTPTQVFASLVPWLLLFATALFAIGPRLTQCPSVAANGIDLSAAPPSRVRHWGLAAVAIYGGYFNGGLGILLMALYSLTGERSIHTANALKNLNSLVLSLLSVMTFAWAGAVHWPQALIMAMAATAGGFAGARVARRLPPAVIRTVVITTGVIMAGVFFGRP